MNFCEACGTRLGAGERFCSACGKPVGDAAQHPSAAHASANEPLAWEVELPLLSRIMLTQWTGAMLATWLAAMVLLAPVFVAQGEADQLPGLAWIFGAIVAGLWLLGLLVMMLLFRGRYRVRFTVDAKGVLYESLERPVRAATRAGIVAGVLAGRPGVVGAGLLAASREREELRWDGGFNAVYRPAAHAILLRNSWRTVMWVQCRPDNYAEVAASVERQMDSSRSAGRVRSRQSGLPEYLGNTLLASLACAPFFALAEPLDTGQFLPILLYCVALAMVWLIPLFAYIVFAGIAIEIFLVLQDLVRVRQPTFQSMEPYRRLEVLHGDDLVLVTFAVVGAALLAWMSWRYLHGQSQSALISEKLQMEGS